MYTAEALCALGRVDEAVTLLQPQLTTESGAGAGAGSGSNGSLLSMNNVPKQWFLNSHCLLRHTTGTTGSTIHEHKKRIHDMIVAVNNAAAITMSGGSGSQQLAKAQLLLDPMMKANPGKINYTSHSHYYHTRHYYTLYPTHAHVLSFRFSLPTHIYSLRSPYFRALPHFISISTPHS